MEITAKIIKDSLSVHGDRITTFELEYPRFIHSELMTHRMFSRNAMSSRAVPIEKMISQVENDPAKPVHWGINKSGMQADSEHEDGTMCAEAWESCAKITSGMADALKDLGLHKQIVNRLLEPFQMMKTIVTATEYANFFELRCHKDAQPEIKVLADLMKAEMIASTPDVLGEGEWHIPYIDYFAGSYYLPDDHTCLELSLEDALKVSASCCAQVSYRLLDSSVEKAKMIYDKLVESKPIHASPFEHCAKVMKEFSDQGNQWEEGVTHTDVNSNYWSGNFKGWIQYRQLL